MRNALLNTGVAVYPRSNNGDDVPTGDLSESIYLKSLAFHGLINNLVFSKVTQALSSQVESFLSPQFMSMIFHDFIMLIVILILKIFYSSQTQPPAT